MATSTLALSLFFHILATVIWIGGLLVTMILVYPAVRRVLQEQPALYRLLSQLRTRFYSISNLCLATLIVTGLFQMTADPYYDGFLTFDNTWSQVMLAKHLLIVLMTIVGVILQYGVAPALERVSLLREKAKGDAAQWQQLARRETLLTAINCILGVAVLGLSAWAGSL